MSLTFNSGMLFARWDVERVTGEKGLGFHRLLLDVRLHGPGATAETTLRGIGLRLSASGTGGAGYLGRFEPLDRPFWYPVPLNGLDLAIQFEAVIDLRRIDAIEAVRNGGDLDLRLTLRGIVSRSDERHLVHEEQPYHVNQGIWVRTLEQMGYGRTLLLEVPIPEAESAPSLSESVMHLEKAQQAMHRGDWREAIACCRDVLEALAARPGFAEPASSEEQQTPSDRKKLPKDARFHAVWRALKQVTDLAKHADETALTTEWERRDARAVFAAVAGLVARFGSPNRKIR